MYRINDKIKELIEAQNSLIHSNDSPSKEQELEKDVDETFFNFLIEDIGNQNVQNNIINYFSNSSDTDLEELKALIIIMRKGRKKSKDSKEYINSAIVLKIMILLTRKINFWRKLVLMTTNERDKAYLKDIINFKCFYKKIICVIEEYLKSLSELNGNYFIDPENMPVEYKTKENVELFMKIDLSEMFAFIHYLILNENTGKLTSRKIFQEFELHKDFLSILKFAMRNYD
jgi:hypothetical protein